MDESKLRWACRRGMLELDVLLGNYLNEKFRNLSPIDQLDFENLLSCSDQDLFEWLTAKKPPPEKWSKTIAAVIQHAKTRHHN